MIALYCVQFQPRIDLPLELRRRPTGAGTEVYECVVGDRGTEDGVEGSDDEGGGGGGLEGGETVEPEHG